MTTTSAEAFRFSFSLGRLLLLIALFALWLGGLRVLPGGWIVWTFTALFYASIRITCSPPRMPRK